MQHPTREFEAELAQILWSFAAQDLHHFDHLKRIADHASQRLIHIRDESHHLLAHSLTGFNHEFGEKGGIFFTFHERAGAGLYVEDERVNALRKFLAHDGRADQIRTFHGSGHIAQCVKLAIGGSDFGSLTNHGATTGLRARGEIERPEDSH